MNECIFTTPTCEIDFILSPFYRYRTEPQRGEEQYLQKYPLILCAQVRLDFQKDSFYPVHWFQLLQPDSEEKHTVLFHGDLTFLFSYFSSLILNKRQEVLGVGRVCWVWFDTPLHLVWLFTILQSQCEVLTNLILHSHTSVLFSLCMSTWQHKMQVTFFVTWFQWNYTGVKQE